MSHYGDSFKRRLREMTSATPQPRAGEHVRTRLKPESEWDRRRAPLPWHRIVYGENSIGEPVCVVRDADGHAVAEYLSVGDADLIVFSVNLLVPKAEPMLKPQVMRGPPDGR